MYPDRGDVAEVGDPVRERRSDARQPLGAEGERGEGRLEQDALRLPLIHVVALHHAVPAAHLLLVARADPGGGVDVEMPPEGGMVDPGAEQQLGSAEGTAGADHRLGPYLPVPAGRYPPVALGFLCRRCRHSRPAGEARGATLLGEDPLHLDSGADPRAGGDGAGEIGDVAGALRVDLAAEGAGAALDALPGISADRTSAGA